MIKFTPGSEFLEEALFIPFQGTNVAAALLVILHVSENMGRLRESFKFIPDMLNASP